MIRLLPRIVLAAVGAASLGSGAHAQSGEVIPPDQTVRNVVLVHGAFADGSGWRGVYDELKARGDRVTIVQNPLTSFADDDAATRRVLARLGAIRLRTDASSGCCASRAADRAE